MPSVAIAVVSLSSWIGVVAPASPEVEAAAEAFSNAQKAELAHDFRRAAEFYELADELAPSPEALRSAAKNRLVAEQPALAATHAAALLRRYPESDRSRALAAEVLDSARSRVARVSVRCDEPCLVSSDELAVVDDRALAHTFYVAVGTHTVGASFGEGQRVTETIDATAGSTIELEIAAPEPSPEPPAPRVTPAASVPRDAPPPRPPPRPRARLSPVFFGVGAALTAGLGATLIWSGTDVLSSNRDYEADPTREGFDDGRAAERRTNALIGATAAVGAATVVLAVFTDWNRHRRRSPRRTAVRASGGSLEVRF